MGLGLINESDIRSTYDRGYDLIGYLHAVCLLENADFDRAVKMHDVIRDMAIWIASDCGKSTNKWIVHAAVGPKALKKKIIWSEAETISLMQNDPDNLSTLLLQQNQLSRSLVHGEIGYLVKLKFDIVQIAKGAIEKLKMLQVLDLTENNRLKCMPWLLEELQLLTNWEAVGITIKDTSDFELLCTTYRDVPIRSFQLLQLRAQFDTQLETEWGTHSRGQS